MKREEMIGFIVRSLDNMMMRNAVGDEKSEKKGLARAFVDFLNEPENAAKVAEYAYSASPNKAAENVLPAEFLANPVIYPPADILARCELLRPLPPREAWASGRRRNTLHRG